MALKAYDYWTGVFKYGYDGWRVLLISFEKLGYLRQKEEKYSVTFTLTNDSLKNFSFSYSLLDLCGNTRTPYFYKPNPMDVFWYVLWMSRNKVFNNYQSGSLSQQSKRQIHGLQLVMKMKNLLFLIGLSYFFLISYWLIELPR
jgi:hypothetical protein